MMSTIAMLPFYWIAMFVPEVAGLALRLQGVENNWDEFL